jgi:hypothetical protein
VRYAADGTFAEHIGSLRSAIVALTGHVDTAVGLYGPTHPVLRAPETRTILQLTLDRVLAAVDAVLSFPLPSGVRTLCDTQGIVPPRVAGADDARR